MSGKVVFRTMEEMQGWVGREVAVGRWWTVNQDLIDRFAGLNGDNQWIHVDAERCRRESPFGKTIAHGMLTLCLLSSIRRNADVELPPAKMGLNYGSNKIRYTGAVPVDSRIRGRYKLLDLKALDAKATLITWGVTGELEGVEKPVLIAETLTRRVSA